MPISEKRRFFRIAVFLIPVVFFGVVEVLLRVLNVGNPSLVADPFMGFTGMQRLYIKTRDGRFYRTNPSRVGNVSCAFREEVFPAKKAEGTVRVFCLGGSSVYGWGVKKEEAFPALLSSMLQEAYPGARLEVINAGGCGYASYRIRLLVCELLRYEPDIFVIYSGHNEFVERRIYREIGKPGKVRVALGRSYLFNALRIALAKVLPAYSKPVLSSELREGFMKRDEEQFSLCYEHFRFSIRKIIEMGKKRGAEAVLCTLPSNLRVKPKSLKLRLDPIDNPHYTRGAGMYAVGKLREAIRELKLSLEHTPDFAGTYWLIGRCYEALGEDSLAMVAFKMSRDKDAFPERATGTINEILRQIAKKLGVPLVDAEQYFFSDDKWQECFIRDDDVHLNAEGHRVLAKLIFKKMKQARMIERVLNDR